MAKETAHPKNTGGGGFGFEDMAAAYFFACLLTDQPPLDPGFGTIERLDFQVDVDGWHQDDVLLTFNAAMGRRRAAVSAKSNQQFSKDAAPSDFVKAAWEAFLDRRKTKFDPAKDALCIVTSPLDANFHDQLHELLSWAREQDSKDLARRVAAAGYGNDLKRSLLKSFACPGEVSKAHGQGARKVADLLQCVHHFTLDFERSPSNDQLRAINLCRSALKTGELEDARRLWDTLCALARQSRPRSGFFNLTRLLDQLRGRFQLKSYPQHEGDWARLNLMSQDNAARIPDRIGGRVKLPREREVQAIRSCAGSLMALIGPSGFGKSALCKRFFENNQESGTVLWFNARSFDVADFLAFEGQLHLQNSLTKLVETFPSSTGYVVIDGLDRFFEAHVFANVATLLGKLNAPASPWRVIVTSQPEEWSRLQYEFVRANFRSEWTIVDVKEPEDLGPVWTEFPDLERLSFRRELKTLLLNPSVLDLLATRIDSANPEKWAGESDVIEWLWQSVIAKAPHAVTRSAFVNALAEKQGDRMRTEIPLGEFAVADQQPLDELVLDRICTVSEGRASFHHDRYGDWARQRILLSRIDDLKGYLKDRISTPSWHPAVRLLGLHLLEQYDDVDRWKAVFRAAATTGENDPSLLQDLLLDAVIFAASPIPLFERLWPKLTENEGFWLKRLLARFLHVATLPHPMMMRMLPEAIIEASAALRLPYWPYWIPVLRFLYDHKDEVVTLAPQLTADIVNGWLRQGDGKWPLRIQVAEIGLALGRQTLASIRDEKPRYSSDKCSQACFRAALACAQELPDDVAQLALDAAERTTEGRTRPTHLTTTSRPHGRWTREYPPAWPDGPYSRIATSFSTEVLEMVTLQPLMLSRPEVAREVLLAALIEEPITPSPWGDHSVLRDRLHVEENFQWFPPFYTRGPFLLFLKLSRKEGLEVILRLVNFAFERWADSRTARKEKVPTVKVDFADGARTLIGDYNCYTAYSDNSQLPHSIVSALMALEKWLYDEIEENRPVDAIIETIFLRGNCVAFMGLLNAVAGKQPSLWAGPLRPLLGVAEFHDWEMKRNVHGQFGLQMMGWSREPGLTRLAREWHTMPHRQKTMDGEAFALFMNNEEIRAYMTERSKEWEKRLSTETDSQMAHALKQMAPKFRIENWEWVAHPQHGQVLQYKVPEQLRLENEEPLRQIADRQKLIFFPEQCCRRLTKGAPLELGELEALWQELQQFSQMSVPPEDEDGILRVENCICGGIAVLLALNGEWLAKNPDRKAWCVEKFVEVFENPPPPPRFDYEGDSSDSDWRTFCARIIIYFWAEAPEASDIRRIVAGLVASRKYKTVEVLFETAAKLRIELGDSFRELQDFLFDWAAARWKHRESQGEFKVFEWIEREGEAFAHRRRIKKNQPWDIPVENSDSTGQESLQIPEAWADFPQIDLELVQAAYSWLPRLAEAKSPQERAEWIAFWRHAQELSLQVATAQMGDSEASDTSPYRFDEWTLDRITALMLELESAEERESFWKPFLGLGTKAHYWVDRFLSDWFMVGIGGETVAKGFAGEWRKMILFAHSCELWTTDPDWRRHREEIWISLMGLDVQYLWTADLKDLVAEMRDLFEKWALIHLNEYYSAAVFAHFLQNPAAEKLLCEGILWLDNADLALTRNTRSGRLAESFASLLAASWQHHRSEIRANDAAFAAFKRLLEKLCVVQNKIALELADRMRVA